MELFDFCDASLLSHFSKAKDLEKHQQRQQGFDQKSLILNILQRNLPKSQKTVESHGRDPIGITKFDCKLAEHLKKHGIFKIFYFYLSMLDIVGNPLY